jgi:hypothetical protein
MTLTGICAHGDPPMDDVASTPARCRAKRAIHAATRMRRMTWRISAGITFAARTRRPGTKSFLSRIAPSQNLIRARSCNARRMQSDVEDCAETNAAGLKRRRMGGRP